jgi:zona occludens toxin
MIIFHEGLPRSGKSYEAMVRRILVALISRRVVVAYIEGIDHAKIAPLAGLTETECRDLLKVVTREQMVGEYRDDRTGKATRLATWLEHTQDNALHVFDEAQNFWPNKAKMTDGETAFVTEHGHRGIDVVLMGQDYRDVHALWRRRIELKLSFLKLSALGAGKRYSVTTYRHKGGDDYEKVGTQTGKYDPKYFGTYASHTDSGIQTGDYKDSRALLWNTPLFKYLLPVAVGLAIWGGFYAWGFFHRKPADFAAAVGQGASAPAQGQASRSAASAPAPAASVAPPETRSPQEVYVTELSGKSRIRLAGLIVAGKRVQGVIEWVDGNTHVNERMTLDALRDLGASVIVRDGSVQLGLGRWAALATSWPMEAEGKVSEARAERMKPGQDAPTVSAAPSGPVSLSGTVVAAREPVAGSVDVPRSRSIGK